MRISVLIVAVVLGVFWFLSASNDQAMRVCQENGHSFETCFSALNK